MQELYSQLQGVVERVIKLLPQSYDYNETHYQKVLAHELRKCDAFSSFEISQEVVIPYHLSDGFVFGYGRADLILLDHMANSCIIIELKASVGIKFNQMEKYRAQLRKYMRHYHTRFRKKGVLIVFNPCLSKLTHKIVL